jgi:hypothetical protein
MMKTAKFDVTADGPSQGENPPLGGRRSVGSRRGEGVTWFR